MLLRSAASAGLCRRRRGRARRRGRTQCTSLVPDRHGGVVAVGGGDSGCRRNRRKVLAWEQVKLGLGVVVVLQRQWWWLGMKRRRGWKCQGGVVEGRLRFGVGFGVRAENPFPIKMETDFFLLLVSALPMSHWTLEYMRS